MNHPDNFASPRSEAGEATNNVVVLSHSLDEDCPTAAQHLTPKQVAQWTLKDVATHVFFMVWVCGIPVHVQYIVPLLEHSGVIPRRGKEQLSQGGSARESLTAVAQADVLAPVCRRAAELSRAFSQWPNTGTPPLQFNHQLFSELVPLGVVRKTGEHGGGDIRPVEGGERLGDYDTHKAMTAPFPSYSTVQAGAVTPVENFANVTAVALCSPAERDGASMSSAPSATWCAQAYWTAFSQAQQWIAAWPSASHSAGSSTCSYGAAGCTSASAATHLQPARKSAFPNRKGPRCRDAHAADQVVVVDADEETSWGTLRGAGAASRATEDNARALKVQRCEAAEVVVIDSDEDDL
ncbi:hypothetical protein JKF63_06915 [Porcisia hertigi]|uniref:Uncharacterized protein n=1 Tax=Porcisia hertigi TaxID=2761500 RepID=A0A836YHB6_9TRYP|nr:hypothetical protein JKF63_06915 [Porcisia hertigi]